MWGVPPFDDGVMHPSHPLMVTGWRAEGALILRTEGPTGTVSLCAALNTATVRISATTSSNEGSSSSEGASSKGGVAAVLGGRILDLTPPPPETLALLQAECRPLPLLPNASTTASAAQGVGGGRRAWRCSLWTTALPVPWSRCSGSQPHLSVLVRRVLRAPCVCPCP